MIDKREIIKLFENLGLKENEAKVYFANLQVGQSTVGPISEESGVERTVVYDVLRDLGEKGLVTQVQIRGRDRYSAIPIDQMRRILTARMEKLDRLIPEIKALEKTVGDKPKVQFFEGRHRLLTAQFDTLNIPKGSEILAYAAHRGLYYDDPDFAKEYIKKRVAKNISVRAIMPESPDTKKHLVRDKKELRTSRVVSSKIFPFTNEINIYGNKVAILSYVGELVAVIIESESIAKTQRAIFELAWDGTKKHQKNF